MGQFLGGGQRRQHSSAGAHSEHRQSAGQQRSSTETAPPSPGKLQESLRPRERERKRVGSTCQRQQQARSWLTREGVDMCALFIPGAVWELLCASSFFSQLSCRKGATIREEGWAGHGQPRPFLPSPLPRCPPLEPPLQVISHGWPGRPQAGCLGAHKKPSSGPPRLPGDNLGDSACRPQSLKAFCPCLFAVLPIWA